MSIATTNTLPDTLPNTMSTTLPNTMNQKYSEFIELFVDMIFNNLTCRQNTDYKVSISIGKRSGKYFQEYLHTGFKNPVVIVNILDGHARITIRNFSGDGGHVTFNMDYMNNIQVQKIQVQEVQGAKFGKDTLCGTLRSEIDFHYVPADMDYHIQIVRM